MFHTKQPLIVTTSGHYAIPIGERASLEGLNEKKHMNILHGKTVNLSNKEKKAKKRHSQFSHSTPDKLIKLISNTGLAEDMGLIDNINKISKECQICMVYKRPFPKLGDATSLATEFNEVVAIDIKVFMNTYILHLIDHVTRFSAAAIVKSKEKEGIIKNIFKIWSSIYGPPSKCFSDNGGKFSNENCNEMCEVYKITVKKTATETPFLNGLAERHNAVLEDMLLKTCEDKKC